MLFLVRLLVVRADVFLLGVAKDFRHLFERFSCEVGCSVSKQNGEEGIITFGFGEEERDNEEVDEVQADEY